MSARLSAIQKELAGNVGKEVTAPYVSPCYDFEQVLKLSSLPRVGWNIDVPGTIKVENQPVYTAALGEDKPILPIRETIMQHIMESVYIAQLFLPDNFPEKDYQNLELFRSFCYQSLAKHIVVIIRLSIPTNIGAEI